MVYQAVSCWTRTRVNASLVHHTKWEITEPFQFNCFEPPISSLSLALERNSDRSQNLLTRTVSRVGFPCGWVGKESTCKARDLGLIPGQGRSRGGGHGNPLQCSCLGHLHGLRSLAGYSPRVAKSRTRLSGQAQHSTSLLSHRPARWREESSMNSWGFNEFR